MQECHYGLIYVAVRLACETGTFFETIRSIGRYLFGLLLVEVDV